MELVTSGTDTKLLNDAVRSLASDSGIHPLVPYFVQFIQDEVRRSAPEIRASFAFLLLPFPFGWQITSADCLCLG